MSDEHSSVGGTFLQAWASHESFQPKDGPPDAGGSGPRNAQHDFNGEKRRNDTHTSSSDPDARLYRKGNTGARMSYMGHALMEHRNVLMAFPARYRAGCAMCCTDCVDAAADGIVAGAAADRASAPS